MKKGLSALIIILLISVTCSWGQERFVDKFKEKFKSYRTFSEFDAFFTTGFGEYPVNRGGLTFSLGKQITDEFSCSALLGVEWYPKYVKDRPFMYSNMLMPIGINIKRYFVSNPRRIPHLSLDVGCSVPFENGGFFAVPAVGLGLGNFKFQLGFSIQNFKDIHLADVERNILTGAQMKVGFFF